MNYLYVNDDRLLELANHGDSEAEDQLVKKYIRLVRQCARPLFLAGGDSEDLIQEGMMGLLSAIRKFNPQLNTSFKTYAEICIRRRLISAVKSASSLKHNPLNDGVPLDILSEDSQTYFASGQELHRRVPEEQVLARESESEIVSTFSQCLSKYETKILSLYLEGLSYREMAESIGKTEKSIDNAVQRIRKKLARQPDLGDNS
ncbi:MAG: sigma-70 family RNA polymerase sigma factor [Oscillospiraceae bacterium]